MKLMYKEQLQHVRRELCIILRFCTCFFKSRCFLITFLIIRDIELENFIILLSFFSVLLLSRLLIFSPGISIFHICQLCSLRPSLTVADVSKPLQGYKCNGCYTMQCPNILIYGIIFLLAWGWDTTINVE